ncbi:MAG: hypothetical protein JWO56_1842 [Acidobacteria bacterium]|nr:hypothetical protein [Acidobacteriota bacterium]
MKASSGVLGYLIAGYVAYLYLPQAFFRFWLERYVTLGARDDETQLEAFVTSALPSVVLNLMTFGMISAFWFLLNLISGRLFHEAIAAPLPDISILTSFLTEEQQPLVQAMTTGGSLVIKYLALVWLLAALMGIRFGELISEDYRTRPWYEIRQRREPSPIPDRLRSGMYTWRPRPWWDRKQENIFRYVWRLIPYYVSELPNSFIHFFGILFFMDYIDSLNPYSFHKPHVCVRTKDRRLYFGQFWTYEKMKSGEVSSITLLNVQRYCSDEIDQCLRRGDLPIHDFGGPLLIQWDNVADMNRVPQTRIQHLKERYAEALADFRLRLVGLTPEEQLKIAPIYRTDLPPEDEPALPPMPSSAQTPRRAPIFRFAAGTTIVISACILGRSWGVHAQRLAPSYNYRLLRVEADNRLVVAGPKGVRTVSLAGISLTSGAETTRALRRLLNDRPLRLELATKKPSDSFYVFRDDEALVNCDVVQAGVAKVASELRLEMRYLNRCQGQVLAQKQAQLQTTQPQPQQPPPPARR